MRLPRYFRTIGMALAAACAAAVALTVAGPAQAYSPTPGTIYQLPSTQACLKGRGNCAIYPKAAQLPDGKLVASFELSTVPASGSAVGQTLPVYQSSDDGTTWSLLSQVQAPAYLSSNSAYAQYTSAWTNPYLYVLPQAVGNLKAGTLLMAAVVSGDDYYYLEQKAANSSWTPTSDGDRANMAIALYSSTNDGSSWSFQNIITTGGWEGGSAGAIGVDVSTANTSKEVDPVWEPYLMVYNGQLVAYYSDEDDYTGYNASTGALTIDPNNATATDSDGQIIAHRTWDGSSAAWSSAVADVTGTTVSMGGGKTEIGGGRPGMANVVQTSDGQWMLTFEYWGGGDNVRYKLASNPLDFYAVGGTAGTGISSLPVASGSAALAQGGSPVLVRLPGGRLLYNAAGSGAVWMDTSGSSTGTWTEYQTTVPAAYSRSLTYDATTGRMVIVANQGTSTIINADIDFGHSPGTYYEIVNKLTGQVIGTHGNTTDANLGYGNAADVDLENAGSASNPDTQYWHVVTKSGGVTLLNESGGRAAEIWGGTASAGAGIGQWVDNASTGLWTMVALSDGDYEFQSTGNTSLYLTGASTGAALTLQTATSSGAQEWQLVAANSAGIAGSGRALTNVNTATCLDDYNGATANGSSADLWPCTGTALQQFTVTSVGAGQYTLKNANSGTCLDDYDFGTANGSKADLWACDGGTNQNWSFVPINATNYEVVNQASGLCLDDPSFSKTSGVLTDLWTCDGGTNQQWHF
ncbi:RICIN domain-containing protein [Actinospica durhamensis]|uniref:RICIN domain-containing protein n=1 Tax=Actinospica durhamensis TaxID=1508375 RepID=A0A941IPA6_9ACTN|nr:RICIN domain-containing protein [Actinospica durhamensis]MBR7832932.1 RICIN domain-containing protein [Actinospica durhamensis]